MNPDGSDPNRNRNRNRNRNHTRVFGVQAFRPSGASFLPLFLSSFLPFFRPGFGPDLRSTLYAVRPTPDAPDGNEGRKAGLRVSMERWPLSRSGHGAAGSGGRLRAW